MRKFAVTVTLGALVLPLGLAGLPFARSADAAMPQCANGLDDDGDGSVDFPADFSCSSALDSDESAPRTYCQNGLDDDGDRLIDFADPGCHADSSANNPASYNPQRNDEGNFLGQCSDDEDADEDQLMDFADPECHTDGDARNPWSYDGSRTEARAVALSQCQDQRDNDADGLMDFPQDPGCSSAQDSSESKFGNVSAELNSSAATHVRPGDAIIYTITLRNTSKAMSEDLRLQQNLPSALRFESASDGGYNRYDGIILWSRVNIGPYQTKLLTVTARVAPTVQDEQRLSTILYLNDRLIDTHVNIARVTVAAPSYTQTFPSNDSGMGTAESLPSSIFFLPPTSAPAMTAIAPVPFRESLPSERQPLPRTGIEDFTGSLENTARFLRPISAAAAGHSLPLIAWMLITVTGLLGGGILGTKMLR